MACKGTTKKGKPCRNTALLDDGYCVAHSPKASVSGRFAEGNPGGPGRPRLPRPHELMREKIEEDIERILAPYFDALDNAVMHASFEGEVTASEHPDVGARIAAAEKLLDRVYGRPRQSVEHTGGGPLQTQVNLAVDAEAAKLAHDLLGKLARS